MVQFPFTFFALLYLKLGGQIFYQCCYPWSFPTVFRIYMGTVSVFFQYSRLTFVATFPHSPPMKFAALSVGLTLPRRQVNFFKHSLPLSPFWKEKGKVCDEKLIDWKFHFLNFSSQQKSWARTATFSDSCTLSCSFMAEDYRNKEKERKKRKKRKERRWKKKKVFK